MKTRALAVLCLANCVVLGCAGQTPALQVVSGANEHAPASGTALEASSSGEALWRDGGTQSNEMQPPVVCGELSISRGDVCERTGSGDKWVLRGDILTPETVIEGGSVVVENGRIVYVGCDPDLSEATVITCPGAVLSPGFINGHEHLSYSNHQPASWADERYMHRHEWRKGSNGHTKLNGPRTQHNEVVEIRSLMSGTTSIFGSGKVAGMARNIDIDPVDGNRSVYQTFPLGDTDGTMKSSGCDYNYHGSVVDMPGCPFGPHLGEGISEAAVNELRCLSGEGPYNLFTENLVIVHGTAALPEHIEKMARNDVKLIWSPRSNISLYGDTAQVPIFDRMGVNIGLGTDWIYSGSATMLRELACADNMNKNYYQNYFSDAQLWRMTTWNNAIAFGLDKSLGAIREGYLADIVIYRKKDNVSPHRSIIEAENRDVLFVMLDGKAVYGNAELMTLGEEVDVCGVSKKIDLSAAGAKTTYAEASSHAAYPMFFCDEPEHEPSCVPARLRSEDTMASTRYSGLCMEEDWDGDGILNDEDNCPRIFNPKRPSDLKQADADGDGLGDICDAYPTCASNDATCPEITKNDYDADGVLNAEDNCPRVVNPGQEDADTDGHGDVCDTCPQEANPGEQRCAMTHVVSIADVHRKLLAVCPEHQASCKVNEEMLVSGRVTALTKDGFFMQTPDSNEILWTGIFVESDSTTVQENDDVWVQAWPMRSTGMPSLKHALVKVVSSGNAAITPVIMSAADMTTGGPSAQALTGVLVSVSPATVLALDKNASYYMYPVADPHGGSIYLDDFIWRIDREIKQGMHMKSASGILVYDFGNHKIAPRKASDLVME